jgi:hypothetical protein
LCALPVLGAVLQTVAFCHSRGGKTGSGGASRKENSWKAWLMAFMERPALLGKMIHRTDSMGEVAALNAGKVIVAVGLILIADFLIHSEALR